MESTMMTPLMRTLRRSITHIIGDDERADNILDSIIASHPHLAQVWEENTCRGCRSILTQLDKAEGHSLCEFCSWQTDHDYYVENLRKYGAE